MTTVDSIATKADQISEITTGQHIFPCHLESVNNKLA